MGSGWYLNDVTLDIKSRGEHMTFPCHRWLATDEDDGLIERELYPNEQTNTELSKNILFFFL